MAYTVAIEETPANGEMLGAAYHAWVAASYQSGIPATFIVDGDGKVAWIGHPLRMDEPLAAIVEGRWDLAAQAEEYRAMIVRTKARETAHLFAEAQRCWQAGDEEGHLRVYDETFAAHPDLEQKLSFHKLATLLGHGRSEVVDYARHMITSLYADDDEVYWKVGDMLTDFAQNALDGNKPVDGAVTAFIVETLLQAERTIPAQASVDYGVRVQESLARAFLIQGRADEALARARAARVLAEAASLEPVRLKRIDALLERCATAAPAPKPNMVCEDGVCRIIAA